MFQKAAQVFGQPFRIKQFPGFAINLVGAMNSIIARLTGKTPQLSYSMAKMASVKQFYSPATRIRAVKIGFLIRITLLLIIWKLCGTL
jgi:hypothetical protein